MKLLTPDPLKLRATVRIWVNNEAFDIKIFPDLGRRGSRVDPPPPPPPRREEEDEDDSNGNNPHWKRLKGKQGDLPPPAKEAQSQPSGNAALDKPSSQSKKQASRSGSKKRAAVKGASSVKLGGCGNGGSVPLPKTAPATPVLHGSAPVKSLCKGLSISMAQTFLHQARLPL